jgi:cytochrome c biogenesis protein CcmG, thiol:disulfide interchange protein DsbE
VKQLDRLFLPLIGLLCLGLFYQIYDATRGPGNVALGDKAPAFTVTTDSGRNVSLDKFGGKLLVLNFWATWCPPCVEEIPSLDRLQQELGPKGLVVLAVSVDKNDEKYKRFVQTVKPSFDTVRDPKGTLSVQYGTFKFPETYIINAEGKVVDKLVGPRDWTSAEVFGKLKTML